MVCKPLYSLFEGLVLLELLLMSDVPAAFYREGKIVWRTVVPVSDSGFFRQSVKSTVDFERIKLFGIVTQPLLFGQIIRVEYSFPFRILVTRAATVKVHYVSFSGFGTGMPAHMFGIRNAPLRQQ